MKMKVCLDAGHGGDDPGATFRGALEKTICLDIVKRCAALLWERCDIVLTRATDVPVGITRRAQIANEARADLFVSVHCNADPDPDGPGMREARGAEIWVYPGSQHGRLLATHLRDRLVEAMPDEPWRGIKEEAALGVLHLTSMPAALIEVGFIDNSNTVRELQDPLVLAKLAAAIAAGVEDYCAAILPRVA